MKFFYNTDSKTAALLEKGTTLLLEEYADLPKNFESLQISVTTDSAFEKLLVSRTGQCAEITCKEPAHYFRGLNYLLHHAEEDFELKETPFFTHNGFMLDCSRNAVATPDKIKKLIRVLAKAGMNQLLLYTEDTYEIPGQPYFGTYRGRYSQEELRQLDSYAQNFGIELVPCIQTLAHLRNALKWPMGQELKDTSDILMVGSEKVYAFLEQALTSLKDCFSSRNIHIGMDEALMLGLGNYLKENGYKESSLLIREHSQRILEICRKMGWKPMMWSDMYITSNTGKGYYDIDENTDTSTWTKPDEELGLVYWDYYHADRETYHHMLRVHKELSPRTIFAGGIWNWNGIAPNYGKAFQCTISALKECQSQGISEVFATGWLDNGAETPLDALYPGLILFATLCFRENPSGEEVAQSFADCVDAPLEDFYLLDNFDALFQGTGENLSADNPSKYLLYQDPMLGIFDYHIQGVDTKTYYGELADKLAKSQETSPKYADFFSFYEAFAKVLAQKAGLGICLKDAYDKKDLSTLRNICTQIIPNILKNFQTMHLLREKLWLQDAKPFGYELMDIKLAGVKTRLESTARRVMTYVNKEVDCLEELEQPRLPYWTVEAKYPHDRKTELRENLWNKIISGCDLIDTV